MKNDTLEVTVHLKRYTGNRVLVIIKGDRDDEEPNYFDKLTHGEPAGSPLDPMGDPHRISIDDDGIYGSEFILLDNKVGGFAAQLPWALIDLKLPTAPSKPPTPASPSPANGTSTSPSRRGVRSCPSSPGAYRPLRGTSGVVRTPAPSPPWRRSDSSGMVHRPGQPTAGPRLRDLEAPGQIRGSDKSVSVTSLMRPGPRLDPVRAGPAPPPRHRTHPIRPARH